MATRSLTPSIAARWSLRTATACAMKTGCPEFQGAGLAALPKLLAATSVQPPTLDVEVASGEKKAAPASTDSDSDGVKDEEDRCPVQAEDSDGFEDEDGCREPDNDDDGRA